MGYSAIDAAVIGALQGDSQLRALLPDGVYFGEAAPGRSSFCLVSLATGDVEGIWGGSGSIGIVSRLYLVQAVVNAKASSNVRSAADRIDALLQDATLTVNGYNFMDCSLEEPFEDVEVDEVDPTIRWQHFGGYYRVQVSVIGA